MDKDSNKKSSKYIKKLKTILQFSRQTNKCRSIYSN
jgi:hypothetical protein